MVLCTFILKYQIYTCNKTVVKPNFDGKYLKNKVNVVNLYAFEMGVRSIRAKFLYNPLNDLDLSRIVVSSIQGASKAPLAGSYQI